MTSVDPLEAFASAREEGLRAGVLLDFDGTLSPIVARPDLARMQPGGREALNRLTARYAVVAVVSGRTAPELEALIDVPGIHLVASYGLRAPEDLAPAVIEAVRAAAAAVPGARVELKGGSVAIHVRGTEDPDAADEALRGPLASIGRGHGLDLIDGKRVLELVPAGRPLKEGAVERLLEEERLEAALYAGDDVADLRAFAALDRAREDGVLTVKIAVRGEETPEALAEAADLVVDGPPDLVRLLERL
jgi:trehalose 6-phosphate phosphatase